MPRFARRFSAVGLAVAVCGCASSRQGPVISQRIQDPPQLSPYSRPLTTPGQMVAPYGAMRPSPATPPQPTPAEQSSPATTISPKRPSSNGEEQSPPDAQTLPQGPDKERLSAPPPSSLGRTEPKEDDGASIARGHPVELTVTAPEMARIGDALPFAIKLRNAQPRAIDDVTVLCALPDGIVFPGKSERAFRQRLGRLNAGEERSLDLSLRAEQAGRHCVEFRAAAGGFDEVLKSVCVVCRDESVKLDIIGPAERTTGSRAEFVVTLANLTGRELRDVHVLVEHDGVLDPREASAGVLKSPGKLEWDLGLVQIDERVQIQVEFACGSATEQTCLAARIVGRDLDPREVKACLKVVPLREIEIDVFDDQDPVVVGEKVRYHVRVTNHRLEAVSGLNLQFNPAGVQPVGVSVDEVDVLSTASFDPVTGVLTVPLPGTLDVEQSWEVTVQTTATHAGNGGLRATVTERQGSMQESTVESTVVNPLPGSIASGNP